MTLKILDGPTIKGGESLSDGIDCSEGKIVRITVPQEYTSANLTFQVSSDGNLYNDLYAGDGTEITVAAKANTGIVIAAQWVAAAIGWIKFRSGTRVSPVKQKEDCKFGIAIEAADAGAPAAAGARR